MCVTIFYFFLFSVTCLKGRFLCWQGWDGKTLQPKSKAEAFTKTVEQLLFSHNSNGSKLWPKAKRKKDVHFRKQRPRDCNSMSQTK